MSVATVARLKITLDDVKPVVRRRVEVPFDIRLDRLHLTIQAAMGWTNSHLYEIRAGGVGWSTPYPDADWAGDFLEAIADPGHERHRELKEWLADDFNPHVVDVDWLSEDVAKLAQRCSRQPAVRRRRTA